LKRVLIISISFDEKKQLQDLVKGNDPALFDFEVTASFGQDSGYWATRPPAVLILHLPDDDNLQSFFIEKIKKDIPKVLPLVILCPRISSSLMALSQAHSKLRFFKMPMEPAAVYRALIDLTRVYKEGERQVHPRYQTHQPVEVTSDFMEGRMPAIMKNLSMSGAYFEADSAAFEIKANDLLKISVYLAESNRQYIFDVKVVWSKPQTSGAIGYGVTFVNKEEVYNSLLKSFT
jgi:hypothetical protein